MNGHYYFQISGKTLNNIWFTLLEKLWTEMWKNSGINYLIALFSYVLNWMAQFYVDEVSTPREKNRLFDFLIDCFKKPYLPLVRQRFWQKKGKETKIYLNTLI